jgi:hypothetical protein
MKKKAKNEESKSSIGANEESRSVPDDAGHLSDSYYATVLLSSNNLHE